MTNSNKKSTKVLAEEFLQSKGSPALSSEITNAVLNTGQSRLSGKTPEASVKAAMYTEKEIFKNHGGNMWGLVEWDSPDQKRSVKALAEECLRLKGKPASADEITEFVVASGQSRLTGKTPDASVKARMYTEPEIFKNHGKNLWGLVEWDSNTGSRKPVKPILIDKSVTVSKPAKLPNYKTHKPFLYEQQEGICYGCGDKYAEKDLVVDHRIPRKQDGVEYPHLHHIDNLQLLCGNCNSSKGNKTMNDWKPNWRSEIIRYHLEHLVKNGEYVLKSESDSAIAELGKIIAAKSKK